MIGGSPKSQRIELAPEKSDPGEWKIAQERIRGLSESIFRKAKDVKVKERLWNEQNQFAAMLRAKYSDEVTTKCLAFKLLARDSDITYDESSRIDLPGEDSIESFLEKMNSELEK